MAELSGFEVLGLTKEIETRLRGTYVKNIYSLGSSQVFRFGRAEGEDSWLVASPRYGSWVSSRVTEREETTGFTTALRREVVRLRFVSARQVDLDRIYDICLGEEEREKHLILELMPPGNVVVTDSRGRVIIVLRETRSPSRRLVKGEPYRSPPQSRKSPSEASESDVSSALGREKTAGGAIGRNFALPRKYVAEVLARLGVGDDSPSATLAGREAEVVSRMKELLVEAGSSQSPCVCETPKGDEIFAIVPRAFKVKTRANSLSELCDQLFLEDVGKAIEPAEDASASKRRELGVTISRLKAQEEGLLVEAAKTRESAGRARAAQSVEEAISIQASAGVRPSKQSSSQEGVVSSLYDRAKELEKKADDARKAAEELAKKRPAERTGKRKATKELRLRKGEWYEKFRWFFTSRGKLAIGGRDAQSNSILVKRHLDAKDTVYHADLFGSPFFLLKGGKEQTDEEQHEVAQATVAFSSAWKTGLGSADAYWVNDDQVSTSAPSGEFLPKGGFLIKGKKNFVPHNLVELAVGLDDQGRVVSGPESAIKGSAVAYVIVRPHKEKSSETAKRLAKDLESIAGERVETRISVDEMLRMLPAGGAKVLRKHTAPPGVPETRNA